MSLTKLLFNLTSAPSPNMDGNKSFGEVENGTRTTRSMNGKGATNGSAAAATKNGNANGSASSSNKAMAGRRAFGENGFEEHGGYMAAKKAKLDNQFNTSTRLAGNGEGSEIFKGLSIYINGYTNPPEPELRELFVRLGGTFHPYRTIKTSYVIATCLSAPSKRLYSSKTLTPDWIMDSIAAGKVREARKYKLYDLNRENKQMTLTQVMGFKKATNLQNGNKAVVEHAAGRSLEETDSDSSVINGNGNGHHHDDNREDDDKDRVSESDEDEFFECSQEILKSPTRPISLNGGGNKNGIGAQSEASKTESNGNGIHAEDMEIDEMNGENSTSGISLEAEPTTKESSMRNGSSPNKPGKIKTATDEGFIDDFFGRSRLHLISEQKKDMQELVANMRKNISSHSFHNLRKFEEEVESKGVNGFSMEDTNEYLMHIDLDCFFVSVGLLSRPHLRGKPVVVTHSTGKLQDSKSDIACASYEARKFGVRNGMWVGGAKELCPSLVVIPYDFEEYRRVSKRFFEAVTSITLDIEPNSVDEMVVNVTSVLRSVPGSTPEGLAEFFRKIILEATKCPASIGIGSNRLLAKLAVKRAKPDGVHHLKDCDAADYIERLNVGDLSGIGYSIQNNLRDKFGVETCGDLLKVPLKDLKAGFGEKTAEKMHNLCRGIDTSETKFGERPKSISVDVNFGIRFTKDDDVTNFIINICKELGNRAERIQALSTHFQLKLLIRKKGAGEPLKQGGHGICDSITRSRSLMTPTRSWQEFYKTACSFIRLMRVPPADYRGVGVTLTELTFDCDKIGKKSVQRTLTDMPIISSRGQKMLAITQKKNRLSSSLTPPISALNNDSENQSAGSNASAETVQLSNGSGSSSSTSIVAGTVSVPTDVLVPENNQSNETENSKKLPVDINVLRQLPREIAEEQCQFYGISKDVLDQVDEVENGLDGAGQTENQVVNGGTNGQLSSYYDNIESVDQSFLSALPDNVRQDVLIQLQEAKGRRNLDVRQDVFDDQQPCSSRQALERSKRLEEQRKATTRQNGDYSEAERSPLKMNSAMQGPLNLQEQTTPIIDYSSGSSSQLAFDPAKFWDLNVAFHVLPPKQVSFPALNEQFEVAEVRNMIRHGLEVVSDPTPEDAESLEKYFKGLVENGWLNHTETLLKFVQRRIVQMGEASPWAPILTKLVEDTQQTCQRLHQGELDLES